MSKIKAIYVRVSSAGQDTASQEPDLTRWAQGHEEVKWFTDKETGRSMDRPEWNRLMEMVRLRKVSDIVVWRLDRLGRTASGLTTLFNELTNLKVNLVSLRDGIDLQTSAGRLMANVLASVSQYETEIRRERVQAGIAAAKSKGKRWGGSKKGVRKKVTDSQADIIRKLRGEGEPVSTIAEAMGLSRKTIYSILKEA